MKATELRIGNLFIEEISREVIKVIEISKSKITFTGEFTGKWQAKSIPLTEEWLLKFGFIKVEHIDGCSLSKDGVNIGLLGLNNTEFCFNAHVSDGSAVFIKHVHQLQNLFFSLTGEELTIKE